jgi:hypothetical protein
MTDISGKMKELALRYPCTLPHNSRRLLDKKHNNEKSTISSTYSGNDGISNERSSGRASHVNTYNRIG